MRASLRLTLDGLSNRFGGAPKSYFGESRDRGQRTQRGHRAGLHVPRGVGRPATRGTTPLAALVVLSAASAGPGVQFGSAIRAYVKVFLSVS